MPRSPILAASILAAATLGPAVAAPLKALPETRAASEGPSRMPSKDRFPTLDAYLAWLEKRGQLDGAWYRQVRPGIYELQPGNLRRTDGAQPQRTFTRQELEKKFGYSR